MPPVSEIMKNKSGRSIWFRRYYGSFSHYPSTLEDFALLLGGVAALLGLPYGCNWLIKAKSMAGLAGLVFPLLGLVGYALLPLIVVGILVIVYRHSGPPD